ncbi:hypothetical protein HYT32_00885 [Candidatus Roizmanbacteria bacterium]|nr:hypothetical protein [Candidatus Roizmanbacteria bacterium]
MAKLFQQLPSVEAMLAGVFALAYAYFFVIARDAMMYSLSLLLLGIFSLKVMIALFGRLRNVNEYFARVAMVLGVIGTAGMAVHGGYDLANAINPPTFMSSDLPSQVDPRGLLSFGFTGVAILKFSYLMRKDNYFPTNLQFVGAILGTLLIVIYLARLTVMDPTNPVLLYPVLLNGFILSPLWYFWIGFLFKRK